MKRVIQALPEGTLERESSRGDPECQKVIGS